MATREREVSIPVPEGALEGMLVVPPRSAGIGVLIHGSGSSRHSGRNARVAQGLEAAGIATLRFDLLTPEEASDDARTHAHRFDLERITRRPVAAVDWLVSEPEVAALPVGLFGASTGAAGALAAAAHRSKRVRAVACRGGRPDLVASILDRVRAPVLLVVGEHDPTVRRLNAEAQKALSGRARLEIVPGAGHLFEEPGALDTLTESVTAWFAEHLRPPAEARR